jgi:MYXO-CTERM domain-containing protein
MSQIMMLRRALVAGLAVVSSAAGLEAAIYISEVAAWSSGNSPVGGDWFEVTNSGPGAVNISGWRMDDNSNSFANSVALTGVTSIAAGESVIFIETTSATTVNTFRTLWNVPSSVKIGTYSGSGVGLSTGGDAVNLFTSGGALQANVAFGASPAGPNLPTFDNAAGLTGTISQLSAVGVNGAYAVAGSPGNTEIGSPGFVPAPGFAALAGLAGLTAVRRSRRA